jgi:hypothetical protein
MLLPWGAVSVAQETHLELLNAVSLKADFIETDNIGNVYTVKEFEITKRDISGKEVMKNSALAFGNITSLDASNALKMVLFFKDLSQVVYLDNQLSTRGERVELDFMGYSQTTAICRSYNDGLWLYDQTTFELTRLDEQLQPTAQSGNLNQILGFVPNPNYIREYNNWVYVNDPEQGILVFDWYGSFTKTIPIKGLSKFVIRANKMFFLTEGKIESYDLKTAQFAEIKLNEPNLIDFTLYDDKLLLITQKQLLVYRIIVN